MALHNITLSFLIGTFIICQHSNINFVIILICTMKNLTVLCLAVITVMLMLYAGLDGLSKNYSYGPFITFIGVCTAVGVAIDVVKHIQIWIRKSNVRKLGRF